MARPFIIEDTSFLVSIIDPQDIFHKQALECLEILLKYKLTYVYPDIVLNEAAFIMMKSKLESRFIRKRITSLTLMPRVIIHNNDALTSIRYTSGRYNFLTKDNSTTAKHITKTNDYIISCNAIDYNAVVITGDKQIVNCLQNNGIACLDYTSPRASVDLSNMIGNSHI
jgi:predicted nucleic acid-binding protein